MSEPSAGPGRKWLVFVYDSLMSGEPEHARLAGATALGAASTEPTFDLVELGPQGGLVPGGSSAIRGELYELATPQLASLDVHQGHPLRYKRITIRLDDGRSAEAYTLAPDQTRGRRRIRSNDWRTRMGTPEKPAESAWSRFARDRGRIPR